jgi:uncharacterized protein with PIN domain
MDDFLDTINIRKRTKRICPMCATEIDKKTGQAKEPTEFLAQEGEIWCKKCRPKAQKLESQSYRINYSGDSGG